MENKSWNERVTDEDDVNIVGDLLTATEIPLPASGWRAAVGRKKNDKRRKEAKPGKRAG